MLALFLAVPGRWTANVRAPAVTLANLLAGFAMLAISWRLARGGRRATGLALLVLLLVDVSLTDTGRSLP